jgi:hypothetical protein
VSDSTVGNSKVGVISCSGEEIPEGTISRLATRRVLESLRPDVTVTLCLPLFLAGNEGERNFARTHPTITVDGCEKQCARWGTEKHGERPVSHALVVSDILGTAATGCQRSSRSRGEPDTQAVEMVAEKIAAAVDAVMAEMGGAGGESVGAFEATDEPVCACMKSLDAGRLAVRGEEVEATGLPIVLRQCAERGVPADDSSGPSLLEMLKVFQYVPPEEESAYQEALLKVYRAYLGG